MYSISAKFSNNDQDRNNLIQGFIAKICEKSLEKVREIKEGGEKYIHTAFRNYCIDNYRKQKKTNDAIEQYIGTIQRRANRTVDITHGNISERMEETLQTYKQIVARNFNQEYTIIFEFIILGYSNIQIGKIMGKPTATIGTIRHRIKKSLFDSIAA